MCPFISYIPAGLFFGSGVEFTHSHTLQNPTGPVLPLLRGFFVSQPNKEDSIDHEKKVCLLVSRSLNEK